MFVEKVNALARFMRLMHVHRPVALNMTTWGNQWLLDLQHQEDYAHDDEAGMLACDTPMCVAGWAVFLDKPAWRSMTAGNYTTSVRYWGQTSLALDDDQALALFMPGSQTVMPEGVFPYLATPLDVAKVLEHLARTGDVDWSCMTPRRGDEIHKRMVEIEALRNAAGLDGGHNA